MMNQGIQTLACDDRKSYDVFSMYLG
jgi:hypothetical protein